MRKDYIFKCLATPGAKYVLDRQSNSFFTVNEEEYGELLRVEHGELEQHQSLAFEKYVELGVLQKNSVKEIENPVTELLPYFLANRAEHLILQVTQQCNLRCGYCIYSGKYTNSREHSVKKMTCNDAIKAIDFFLARSREMNHISIGFYGGEPLLEFELIKKCVEHVKNTVEGKTVNYLITTNGTLMNDEIQEFLYRNNFMLSISLDGKKEIHDESRQFISGKGTYDVIMGNIERLKKRFPDYMSNVNIMTVLTEKKSLPSVFSHFECCENLSGCNIRYSTIATNGLKEEFEADEEYLQSLRYEYLRLLLFLIGRLDQQDVSEFMQQSFRQFQYQYKKVNQNQQLSTKAHHGGPCIAGARRMFIDTDMNVYPCERVPDGIDSFKIGKVGKGIDVDKVEFLINIGKLTKDQCINCWALPNCTMCSQEIDIAGSELQPSDKLRCCKSEKQRVYTNIRDLCVLNEHNIDLQNEII